jgi:hypothetical protein
MRPYEILVDRLTALYGWPSEGSTNPFPKIALTRLLGHRPASQYRDDMTRIVDEAWHVSRVRFFYDELLAGRSLDPISLDNVCNRGHIYPEPIVLDGHHRLAASILADARIILAWYGGRTDLRDYLTGRRHRCPDS